MPTPNTVTITALASGKALLQRPLIPPKRSTRERERTSKMPITIRTAARPSRIRAIGVSNFHPDRIMDLLVHNQVVPSINQIETQKFLQENGVQIESWGPFAEGKHNIFQNELLRSLADKYHKTVAQIILRWLTQRGIVAIPKSVRKERIAENFNVFDVELSPEDMASIATLDTKTSSFFDQRDPAVVKRLGEAKRPT